MSCTNCGHPIGYHHSPPSGSACTCKDCTCAAYENNELESLLTRARIEGALAMREACAGALSAIMVRNNPSHDAACNSRYLLEAFDTIRNARLPEPMGAELEKLLAEANLNGFRTGEKVAQDDYEVKLAEARAEALQHWCFHFVPQRGWCCSCGFLLLANGTHSDAEHAQSEHVTQWAAEARQGQKEPEGD